MVCCCLFTSAASKVLRRGMLICGSQVRSSLLVPRARILLNLWALVA